MKIETIEKIVCKFKEIDAELLHKKTTKREISSVRQIIIYFSKIYTDINGGEITARYNLTHTMFTYSIRVVNNLINTDKKYKSIIDKIENELDSFHLTEKQPYTNHTRILKSNRASAIRNRLPMFINLTINNEF